MVYIYLSAVYCHLNLDVTKGSLLAGGVFRCPSGISWLEVLHCVEMPVKIFQRKKFKFPNDSLSGPITVPLMICRVTTRVDLEVTWTCCTSGLSCLLSNH